VSNNSDMAMYILGRAESNNAWNGINYNDPITVGMMQWYGTRAATLLQSLSAHYGEMQGNIAADLQAHPDTDGNYWTSRYLNKTEGESLRPILDSADGHAAQQTMWTNDYNGYLAKAQTYGFAESRPQPLIFWMLAYHQSPKRAQQIAVQYGGDSDLDRLYAAVSNEPVLSKYMTYRYTPGYQTLKTWDGVSAPPPFGQTDAPGPPGGDGTPGAGSPGSGGQATTPNASAQLVTQYGDHLITVAGDGKRSILWAQGGQSWSGGGAGAVVPDQPGGGLPVPPPPSPGGGGTIDEVVAYGMTWVNAFYYTQGSDRWKPSDTGGADCSSSTRMYFLDKAGIDIGGSTWEAQTIHQDKMIYSGAPGNFDRSGVRKGDVVICRWAGSSPPSQHMVMATENGDGACLSHGGPGKGPKVEPIRYEFSGVSKVWIFRYL
jgi:hypothetical protein